MAAKQKSVVMKKQTGLYLNGDALWYKDAIIYELHVRSFADSSNDGIGDFRGLASKLDYLQDLGVTAIWLLPFYPSPLRDDGYDIADYEDINPAYGQLRDFKYFLREAHERGLRVITELVMNHTSDQHPWFQRARRAAPGSPERNFYVWSDTPEKYRDARIIFKDFEPSNWSWDAVAQSYYWHRFYSHQPDLNYENPAVMKAMLQTLDFWLDMGVDGFRLDAVPYLFEEEGTNCENLPRTHDALAEVRRHVDKHYPGRMLLAEANQWPEDAVAYFGKGDECHMCFHFPVMPRMFMSLRMEDRYPLFDILAQTPKIPDLCQWALFLRNHDELTLEMVTDEERDYMYRTYAQDTQARINLGIRRRLAPLLGYDRRKIELMNGLLFSLPGTPVVYYGDEIGMGDNVYLGDRNGVRTPMQWSSDRNAGFSKANAQRLFLPVIIDPEAHFEHINVERQQESPNSLLWWMKRLIALRKRHQAFGRGSFEFLLPENPRVVAYLRQYEDETIMVVANLSRLAQYVELDLSRFRGMVPLEMAGHTQFPRIGELPYLLTLGPYAFYWFVLKKQTVRDTEAAPDSQPAELPAISVEDDWEEVFVGMGKDRLEEIMPAYLQGRRWFGGKARTIDQVEIIDCILIPHNGKNSYAVISRVHYMEGDPEIYFVGVNFAAAGQRAALMHDAAAAVLCRVHDENGEELGVLYEALREKSFASTLLDSLVKRRHFKGVTGEIIATPLNGLRKLRETESLEPALVRSEQSNTSLIYGDKYILKHFRKLDAGVNPDLEIGEFFARRGNFPHSPKLTGTFQYEQTGGDRFTLAILQTFVPNEGDAWGMTLESLGRYFEQVRPRAHGGALPGAVGGPLLSLLDVPVPEGLREPIGSYLESARLLGQRTAEMHIALASDDQDPAFAPEPFSALYQRSLYQSMRNLTGKVFMLLRRNLKSLPPERKAEAQQVLEKENAILTQFRSILGGKLDVSRIRIHGDFHLGQVLFTGKDFVMIDFEGEPARAISERRIKRSALTDVAGMVRSFHYAAFTRLYSHTASIRPEDAKALQPWAVAWYQWVSATFLKSYLTHVGPATFVPRSMDALALLFNIYMLEKAVYELGYELNNRPEWIHLPLAGIGQLIPGGLESAA
ncbi:MAG TPA: maltose alpha-D-glucosyltransferase [Terriglobales bacterium]|nr:maltose alpha-D-glucosyltransferase [Terriglobales bacterium]